MGGGDGKRRADGKYPLRRLGHEQRAVGKTLRDVSGRKHRDLLGIVVMALMRLCQVRPGQNH